MNNGLTDTQKNIFEKVRAFRDDIIAGKVEKPVLERLGVTDEFLAVCRDVNHPSGRKLSDRLFRYLMDCMGYYDAVSNEQAIAEISNQIDERIKNIQKHKTRRLVMPKFIFGVRRALDKVETLNSASNVDFADKSNVQNVRFGKAERGFELSYQRDHRQRVSLENNSSLAIINIDGEHYEVPPGGMHQQLHNVTFTQPDEVNLRIDKMRNSGLKEDVTYFFRYVTEVGRKEDVCREIQIRGYDIDGLDTRVIDVVVNEHRMKIFTYDTPSKRYLVIEYEKAVTAKEITDLCFSTLVALGMITTTIYLNECWLVAYNDMGKKTECGIVYQALTDTIHCSYKIFTTNVFPSLVNVAERIDPQDGERRACDIITNLKLSNALPSLSEEVLGKLVENISNYEELRRGIFIVLMGSGLHLEVQAPIYCVALEAISNLGPTIIGKEKGVIIRDKKTWRRLKARFKAVVKELYEEGALSGDENKNIIKKIDTMNKAFNSDKLQALLRYYHYPMRQFDELTLFLRNLLLHGNIHFKVIKGREPEDYMTELSLNLHKLCCAIALLMSGFEGYIINNRKLYGYAGSYKAFIRIGNNLKENYPMYQGKLSGWQRVMSFFDGGVCSFFKRMLC